MGMPTLPLFAPVPLFPPAVDAMWPSVWSFGIRRESTDQDWKESSTTSRTKSNQGHQGDQGRTTPQRFADSRRSSGGRRLPQGEPQDRDRALKTSPGCRSSALWDATPVERSQMFRTQDAPADG